MTPRIDAVVFDLDNTLIDSKVDFALMRARINEYISKRDPDMSLEAPTTMELVARFVQRNHSKIEDDLRNLHLIMDETEIESSIYANHLVDIAVVLGALADMGVKLGLLTRSCERYSKLVLGESMSLFDAISCRVPGKPAKPDPSALLEIADTLGVEVEHLLLVGDHWIDGQCATSAGAHFLAVTTGSSSAEDLSRFSPISVLDDLSALPELLCELTTK
ncbi:MAG: HAD family hydrolase [Theionarchaea archaeon]|nr:HAD family hydrolase [Theionarchaea archaeon]